MWLFVRAVRRLSREARWAEDEGDRRLFVGLAATMVALPIGMLTFDANSFIQVPFLFWIVLGLSAVLIRESELARRVTPIGNGQAPHEPAWARAVMLCCLRRCRRTSSSATRSLRLATAAR